MRSVTSEEHSPGRKAVGNQRAQHPTPGGDELDVEVRPTHRLNDLRLQGGLIVFLVIREHEQPAAVAIGGEHSLEVRLVELELADPGGEVLIEGRAEQDAAHRLEEAMTAAGNAQSLADGTGVSVRRDQVVRAQGVVASISMSQEGGDAGFIRGEAGQRGIQPDVGTQFDGLCPEDGLHPVLGDR
jgi:hypothetical protein